MSENIYHKKEKIGWRNMKGSPDKIIQGFVDYFKKMKEFVKRNKGQIFGDEFIQNKV